MLGGIGHAVVSAVDEACFFHAIARNSQTHYELKGRNPLTENYSALQPDSYLAMQKENQLTKRILTFCKCF